MPPTVASRGMPPPPKEPPPSSTKFLSKYRPGYNMSTTNTVGSNNTACNNIASGGGGGSMITSSSAVNYRLPLNNPALEFNSSNGFGKLTTCLLMIISRQISSKFADLSYLLFGIITVWPFESWAPLIKRTFCTDDILCERIL